MPFSVDFMPVFIYVYILYIKIYEIYMKFFMYFLQAWDFISQLSWHISFKTHFLFIRLITKTYNPFLYFKTEAKAKILVNENGVCFGGRGLLLQFVLESVVFLCRHFKSLPVSHDEGFISL